MENLNFWICGNVWYAHFHDAVLRALCPRQSVSQKRAASSDTELFRGIGAAHQQAILRSKIAECVPLCIACQFCPFVFQTFLFSVLSRLGRSINSVLQRCISLHTFICSRIGTKLSPNFVSVYSTLGGIS